MLKSRQAAGLAAALIALATALPTRSVAWEAGATFCILCGERGLADFILNIVLYAPLGAALAATGWRWTRVLVTGAALSVSIELLQIAVIAGRDASVGDLLANTLGAGAGWLAWRGWARRRALRGRLAAALPSLAALTAVGVLLPGLWLLTPGFPATRYYLQWTADFPHMERYDGEILTTRVGPLDLPGPPGPIERSDSVRALLRQATTVSATFRAGPPPPGLAPIFSIYDHRRREIMLLGADGDDLVYRYRLRAAALRLDGAEVRFPAALEGVGPGEVIGTSVMPGGGAAPGALGYCAGIRARSRARSRCVPGFTTDQTWTLLSYRSDWGLSVRRLLGLVWLFGLFFPAGLLGGRWRDRGIAAGLTVLGLAVAPTVMGFAATPARAVLAALSGIGLGGFVSPLTGSETGASLPA